MVKFPNTLRLTECFWLRKHIMITWLTELKVKKSGIFLQALKVWKGSVRFSGVRVGLCLPGTLLPEELVMRRHISGPTSTDN